MKEFAIFDNDVFVKLQFFSEVPYLEGKPYRKFYEVKRETGEIAFTGIENGYYVIRKANPQNIVEFPFSVSAMQARLALNEMQLLDDVNTLVQQSNNEVQVKWEYASVLYRNDPLIEVLGNELGLSNTDIDDLFILAGSK